MDATTEEQIRENAELVINTFGKQLDVNLGYDEKSVAWVEGYIERNKKSFNAEQIEGLVDVFGSYLGECVRHTYGGKWEEKDESLAVRFDEKNCVFPFNKVEKQFKNGLEDSILSFFTLIPIVFKLGNAKSD